MPSSSSYTCDIAPAALLSPTPSRTSRDSSHADVALGVATTSPTRLHHSIIASVPSATILPPQTQYISSDVFAPAIDGPPSSQSIRALSNQMKKTSIVVDYNTNINNTHRTSRQQIPMSSRPSPSPPLAGKSFFDHDSEDVGVSRKSSRRSTTSSVPSKDRPDSVQFFGRSIFHRRVKSKKETGSNEASLLPTTVEETSVETSPNMKATIFGRRRNTKPDITDDFPSPSKKPLISEPYNFQHLTHTRRDEVANLQRGNRIELASEFSALRAAQPPTNGALKGINADDLVPVDQQQAVNADNSYFTLDPQMLIPSPLYTPGSLLDELSGTQQTAGRITPPRPLRTSSANDAPASLALPPVPPPRKSSRQSIRHESLDPFTTSAMLGSARPATSAGSPRQFQLFQQRHGSSNMDDLPPFEFAPASKVESSTPSNVVVADSPPAWPLSSSSGATSPAPSLDKALPDVPEEGDYRRVSRRRSQISMASTGSSLRPSKSVPLLRHAMQSQQRSSVAMPPLPTNQASQLLARRISRQQHNRSTSVTSDTLGRLDFRAPNQFKFPNGPREATAELAAVSECWEDAVDYCYDHEADADFDYDWDRSSVDVRQEHIHSSLAYSPHVPSLSFSQASPLTISETSTPAMSKRYTANFSLPIKVDSPPRKERTETIIDLCSPEVRDFVLSPSGLVGIATDNSKPLDNCWEHCDYAEGEYTSVLDQYLAGDDEFITEIEPSSSYQSRASTSTTSTGYARSDISIDRHTSTSSSGWTTLTRVTNSSTSLNRMAAWKSSSESLWSEEQKRNSFNFDESELSPSCGAMPPLPETSAWLGEPVMIERKKSSSGLGHASHASESLHRVKSKEVLQELSRPRSRTTSGQAPLPIPKQYGLFPPAYSRTASRS